MKTFTVKIGKGPDEMTFDECMVHIKRVLFWDYIDGEWCDVVPLSDRRWEELAWYIRGAHEREVDALKAENAKLRELVETMHGDMREMLDTIDKGSDTWGYCRYYGERLDAAEDIMRELGIEVPDGF